METNEVKIDHEDQRWPGESRESVLARCKPRQAVSLLDALRQTAAIANRKYVRHRQMFDWISKEYFRALNALYACQQWVPESETIMQGEIEYFKSKAATELPDHTQEVTDHRDQLIQRLYDEIADSKAREEDRDAEIALLKASSVSPVVMESLAACRKTIEERDAEITQLRQQLDAATAQNAASAQAAFQAMTEDHSASLIEALNFIGSLYERAGQDAKTSELAAIAYDMRCEARTALERIKGKA